MPLPLYQRKILIGALLFCLLIITFCIRIQGTGHLSNLQFTGNDAYLYHWQAGIISEHGRLPARDMHRWLPLGRDNGQLLSLYAYAIAYIHKVVPWLSLYHIQLYLDPCSRCAVSSICPYQRCYFCYHSCLTLSNVTGQCRA